MQFLARPEVFERFHGMHIAVAVAHGLDNQVSQPKIEERWREAWQQAAQAAVYGNAQSHPHVRPWREHFQAMGVSGKQFPSSIEALLRRALKGGEPFTINPLVDFYNTVSLQHIVPVGGFDLAQVRELLALRLTEEGDHFLSLDADAPVVVPPGEIAYTAGQTILTRHFVWRQAKAGLLEPTTRDVFLVSEVLGEVGREVAEAVLEDLRAGLADYFGVVAQTWLVDAQNTSISW